MPSGGGTAGKLGDRYEMLWAVDAALRIVEGKATSMVYESLVDELSRGVEFHLTTAEGETEFWSVKRQTSPTSGWTISQLTKLDAGRSILGDLLCHAEREAANKVVFASTQAASTLQELCEVSSSLDLMDQRLTQTGELRKARDKLLALVHGDPERLRQFLQRITVQTIDENSLRDWTESRISWLFYRVDGRELDPAAVRRSLAEFLTDRLGSPLGSAEFLEHLRPGGVSRKNWSLDSDARNVVAELCRAYVEPLRESLIGGALRALPGSSEIVDDESLPRSRRILVTGGAGGGKSCQLAHIVEVLQDLGVPVLPVRMDEILANLLTPRRLGQELSLPCSPVAMLAALANGGPCVLVVDQLDALSFVAGRKADTWSLFQHLLAEADGYPNLHVLVACRKFDLEHDPRMRGLAKSEAFGHVDLADFEENVVLEVLGERKVSPALLPILRVPLHLAMFLELESDQGEQVTNRDELFDEFWRRKEQLLQQNGHSFVAPVHALATWLSDHQELSAHEAVLDDHAPSAKALASERVLVLANGHYRFFHETFFDYAFARRFTAKGRSLLDLLLGSEQHLFRRAQVRQILVFLRTKDRPTYLGELRGVLSEAKVRYHIKRVVFQFLAAVVSPSIDEWEILRDLKKKDSEMARPVRGIIANKVGWFDTLDAGRFFDRALAGPDETECDQAVWLCAMPEVLELRADRVAELLTTHKRPTDPWKIRLQHICKNGNVFHGRRMFDLFLSLIRNGTLDGVHPGFAVNDNWWSMLYSAAEHTPQLACAAIGAWFDRKISLWEAQRGASQDPQGLASRLDEDGPDHGVIGKAQQAQLAFANEMLPRVARAIALTGQEAGEALVHDLTWRARVYGTKHSVHDLLFDALASALEAVARSNSHELNGLLGPYLASSSESIAYLILRAWTAAPEAYADSIATYLAADSRRLRIGYMIGGTTDHWSIHAIQVAAPTCDAEALRELESAILRYKEPRESRYPQNRGLAQLRLLDAFDVARLGPAGRRRLEELKAKFPDFKHEAPMSFGFVAIESPISKSAQEKMNDDQWLSALRKYAGKRGPYWERTPRGGEEQLAGELQRNTTKAPARFLALSARFPAAWPASYFGAVLDGLRDAPLSEVTPGGILLSDVVHLIERVHSIAVRPCGASVVRLVGAWSKADWPDSVVSTVCWYAMSDPDPAEDVWQKPSQNGTPYRGGDPDAAGMNSVRGAAATALAQLLFAGCAPSKELLGAVESLAHDPRVCVRSQGIYTLLALLQLDQDLAIAWFRECVSPYPILLKTRFAGLFVWYAGLRDYEAMRPIVQCMLHSDDAELTRSGAELACHFGLRVPAAAAEAEAARSGTEVMRAAAGEVYAEKVDDQEFGRGSRDLLVGFLSDPAEEVRAKAARAFDSIAKLEVPEQERMLNAFIDGRPNAAALEPVLRALEESDVRLPDVVSRLVEVAVQKLTNEAGEFQGHGLLSQDLSKVVIRLYTQSQDEDIKKRCLDAIDVMERGNSWGLSKELREFER
jgi:hypothetical protein